MIDIKPMSNIERLEKSIERDKQEVYEKSEYYIPKKSQPITFEFIPQVYEPIYDEYDRLGKIHKRKLYKFPCTIHEAIVSKKEKEGLWDEPKLFKFIALYPDCVNKIIKICKEKNINLGGDVIILKIHGMVITHGKLGWSCKLENITYRGYSENISEKVSEKDMRKLVRK